MDAGYAAELADVAGRAALVDVLVDVDDDGRLLGGVTYIPGPGPMAWFTAPATPACGCWRSTRRPRAGVPGSGSWPRA